jgi:hypothetical protein
VNAQLGLGEVCVIHALLVFEHIFQALLLLSMAPIYCRRLLLSIHGFDPPKAMLEGNIYFAPFQST